VNEDVVWHHGTVTAQRRRAVTGGPGMTVWLTGLSGSGKSTIAYHLEESLVDGGRAAYVLDGDNLRFGLNSDLSFTASDRDENVRRVGAVALLLADAGLVAVAPLISPYEEGREAVRARHRDRGIPFLEIFVDTPIAVCEERDPKGLYKAARAGEISNFTGVDDPYEAPASPDLRVDTSVISVDEAAGQIASLVLSLAD
jgi:bifunctional enzyme CysN/CysC